MLVPESRYLFHVLELRIPAMHEANTALLDILVDNSVVGFEKDGLLAELQNVQKLQILLFFTSYIAGILKIIH